MPRQSSSALACSKRSAWSVPINQPQSRENRIDEGSLPARSQACITAFRRVGHSVRVTSNVLYSSAHWAARRALLGQHFHPFPDRREGESVELVVRLRPARPEPQLDPTTGYVVGRHH